MSERSPFPPKPVLGDDEVHVIFVTLDERAAARAYVIDENERRKADRFHFERDRVRYVAAHVALREVVARTLGVTPSAVEWAYGEHGKPTIAGHPELGVNLAHSADRGVIAVAWQREVGVDLEALRALDELETAKVVFSAAEQATLRARVDDRQGTFFRIWASKEAFVKARGDGIGGPLAAFDVAAEPDAEEVLIANRIDDPRVWSIRRIEAGAGYAAAIAASSPPWRAVVWEGIEPFPPCDGVG